MFCADEYGCTCIPYKDLNALCPALMIFILIITNVMAIPLMAQFPGVAVCVFVFGSLAWILFVSIFFCKFKTYQEYLRFMITATSGLIAGVFYLLMGFRLRRPWSSFDIFCNADASEDRVVDGQDFNNTLMDGQENECNHRRGQIALLYFAFALIWIIASIQLFIFACDVKRKLRLENSEGRKQVKDFGKKISQMEEGQLPSIKSHYKKFAARVPPVGVEYRKISMAKTDPVPHKKSGPRAHDNVTKSSREVDTSNLPLKNGSHAQKNVTKSSRREHTSDNVPRNDGPRACNNVMKPTRQVKASKNLRQKDGPDAHDVTNSSCQADKPNLPRAAVAVGTTFLSSMINGIQTDLGKLVVGRGVVAKDSKHLTSTAGISLPSNRRRSQNVTRTFSNAPKGDGMGLSKIDGQQQRRDSIPTPRKSSTGANSAHEEKRKKTKSTTNDELPVLDENLKPKKKKEKKYDEFGKEIKEETNHDKYGKRIKKEKKKSRKLHGGSGTFGSTSPSKSDYSMDATESTASSSSSRPVYTRISETPIPSVATIRSFSTVDVPTTKTVEDDNDYGDYESDYEDDYFETLFL